MSVMRPSLVHISTSLPSLRLKPSRFNLSVSDPSTGALLLYNSLSGNRCAIPRDHAAMVEKVLATTVFDTQNTPQINYLLEKGYLVESAVDEDARLDMHYAAQQYRSDYLELILLSSEQCNLRCVYCSQEFNRGTMIPSVRKGVVELIAARVPFIKTLKVAWFGGEPLVGFEAIREISEAILPITRSHGVSYSSHMTTNGYLLTPARAEKLLDWGVTAYQITLDGTGKQHDEHRPTRGGKGTFDKILVNLAALSKRPEQFRVLVRFNYDRTNLSEFEGLCSSLTSQIGQDPRFSISLKPIGKWGGPNDERLDTCGTDEYLSIYTSLSGQAHAHGLKVEALQSKLNPKASNVCYAARPFSYIIGADGKIMKCTVALDTLPSNVIGKLREDGIPEIDPDKLYGWIRPFYQHDSDCKVCSFCPVCQGASCPLPRHTSGTHSCPSIKGLLPEVLQILSRPKLDSHHQALNSEMSKATT